MKKLFVLLICGISLSTYGVPKDSTTANDTLRNKLFEVSFGQSLLFISYDQQLNLRVNEAIILPTSALNFFVVFRPFKKLRIPLFFNLPTESKQFLIDSVLVNERASPTFGTGLEFQALKLPIDKIDKNSTIELGIGPLVSFLMTEKGKLKFAPIAAARVRIIKSRDFVMYIGTSYSIGIDSWGLIYGTGFLF